MSELPDFIYKLIDDIAKSEGFTKYTTEIKPGSNHGDNFVGVLTCATISGSRIVNGAPTTDQLHLLCKLAPSNEVRRAEFKSDLIFGREVYAYNKILPLFTKFQQEKGLTDDECFRAYPKCYAAVADSDTGHLGLIMEDLRERQFVMWPKVVPFTAEHSFLIVEQLAKLHAVSFALKDQRPEEFEELKSLDDLLLVFFKSGNMSKMLVSSYNRCAEVLESEEHLKIVEEMTANMMELLEDCLKDGVFEPYGVIGHGDCWTNNMLFRYNEEKTDKIQEMCFVDWQVVRYCSPVIDLHYNIFATTDGELRRKEYKNLMKHYYRSLSKNIRRLGSDPDKLFPESAFEEHLKKFGKFGFMMSPMVVSVMLADPNDVPDLDELSSDVASGKDGVDLISGLNDENRPIYCKRMNDVFTDLVDLGYWN